ncbi:MAG: restriction endonuclease [Leptolyngbya sp. UWPOB_LEPTO1]|uniref:restriction endonuclease n=2 Tax=Leptolyngbya group TaxID=3081713 RepID=UPI001AC85EF5|nr:restriction endonuclease [Leptolyngbya sp. UWPOB_LEPTO1]MBN8564811.1 restriction endonuclease [Leptolyngbya sp. UWPOB_LEPTO1]
MVLPPVIQRPDKLPLNDSAFSWDRFESFCLDFVAGLPEIKSCHRYGKQGDCQQGIDLIAELENGEQWAFQCKQYEKFTERKAKQAIQTATYQADRYTLLLSCEATAKVRDAINSTSSWSLWDVQDISQKVRDLPQKAACRILETHFGSIWSEAFLGVTEPISSVPLTQERATIVEKYRNWLKGITSSLIVPGIQENLSIVEDWLSLQTKQHGEKQEFFEAKYIPELYPLSVVTGEPGSGKSTLIKYLSHRLSGAGKIVLRVRLPSVRKILSICSSFDDAILQDAISTSSLSKEQAQFALSNPDYLFADGLDECEDDRANIAEKLRSWASGHSATRIIVTTRFGYEPELFPDWQSLDLLPLQSSEILKFANRLLGDPSNEKKFKSWLETNGTLSVAAKNPLLLGFLIQIFQEQEEPIQNRVELYGKMIELAYKRPLQDRETIDFRESTAKRILEIAGWKLLCSPTCSESELRHAVGKQLASELGISSLQAQNQAEDGIRVWEQRRIFERIRIGCVDSIAFIHRTISEYAAGRYASEMEPEKLYQWITEVRQNPTWQETILFAAQLGATEAIVRYLLELDNPDVANSKEILLAAKLLQESSVPLHELSVPSHELIKVVDRLKQGLELPTRSMVFEAAEALLGLSQQAPDLVGGIAQALLKHSQSWTRLAALRLSLASSDEYVDIVTLENQIDIIAVEVKQNRSNVQDKSNKKHFNPFGRFTVMEGFQSQMLVQGFKFLLERKPTSETAQRIKAVVDQGRITFGTKRFIIKLVLDAQNKALEKLQSKRKNGEKVEQELAAWQTLYSLQNYLFPPRELSTSFADTIIQAKQSLTELKHKRSVRGGEQVFLEAILRISEYDPISLPVKLSQEFPLLGVLIQGMQGWEVTNQDWDNLGQYQNPETVDLVLKGAVTAMGLDLHSLAVEAKLLLEQIQCDIDFDEIESALNDSENSERWLWAFDKVAEIREKTDFFTHVPEVPAIPRWERVKHIELSIQMLRNALDHPSALIKYNAGLILVQKIGEAETLKIMSAKNILNAE